MADNIVNDSQLLGDNDISQLELDDGKSYNFADEQLRGEVSSLSSSVEVSSNKVTSINSSSTDTEYPSAKAVFDYVEGATSGSGNFVLMNLYIKTQPTKKSYYGGESFDATGMVVQASYGTGQTELIKDVDIVGYTVTPSVLAIGTEYVTVSYTEAGVTATVNQPITVKKRTVSIPSFSETFTYNGSKKTPSFSGYDNTCVNASGDLDGTNAGDYTAIFSLKDTTNYKWSDDTITDKSVSWSIGRATISTVPSQSGTITYDGSSHSPSWSNYNSSDGKLSLEVTPQTNAGSYTASFTPTSNYKWSDGSTASKSVSWSIGKQPIARVTASTVTWTYDTQSHIPTFANYVSTKITIGGTTTEQTNIGDFSTTFVPGSNYKWSTGSESDTITISWSITRKSRSAPTVSKSSITLNTSNTSDSFTVTYEGDGTLYAVSSDASVVTTSISNKTVTVNSVNSTSGTVTIDVYVGQSTNYAESLKASVSVTAQFLPVKGNALNTYTWDEIRQVSDAGQAANYWSVGNTKTIKLNGTVGTLSLSNLSINAFIIGFDHNSSKEGTNRIHFQIGKISDKLVGLVDSKYGTNAGNTGDKYFQMNHWGTTSGNYNTNFGGWKGCDLRYDILGSTNVAPSGYGSTKTTSCQGNDPSNYDIVNSPVSNTYMAALPSDLRTVLKTVTKYTDNYGNSSNVADHVTASVDYLFLLSEWEYFGARSYANEYEKNYQAQYAYYAAGNGTIHYKHSDTNTVCGEWERSPLCNNPYAFCIVYTDGSRNANSSRVSYSLAVGFCV